MLFDSRNICYLECDKFLQILKFHSFIVIISYLFRYMKILVIFLVCFSNQDYKDKTGEVDSRDL